MGNVDSVQASYITGLTLQSVVLVRAIIVWFLKVPLFAKTSKSQDWGLPYLAKWNTKLSFHLAIFLAILAEVGLYVMLVVDPSTVTRGDGVMALWARWAFYIIIFTAAGYAYTQFFWFDKLKDKAMRGLGPFEKVLVKLSVISTPALNALTFVMLLIGSLIDNEGRWAPYAIGAGAFLLNLIFTSLVTFRGYLVIKFNFLVKVIIWFLAFGIWGTYVALWAVSDVAEQSISFSNESWAFFAMNTFHSIFLLFLMFGLVSDPAKTGDRQKIIRESKKYKNVNNSGVKNTRKNRSSNPLDDVTADDLLAY